LLRLFLPALFILAPLQVFAQEEIPLEAASDQNTFLVQVVWTPADIGSEHTFKIHFIEPETLKEVEDIVYDFAIEQNGEQVIRNEDQDSNVQSVTFDKPGPYTIVVENIDGLGENASFAVEVTPEFPLLWALPGAFATLLALRKRLSR
jgi:hypothetical protein